MSDYGCYANSIYGPGVLNDTIVPGYGVTKFPVNLRAFWSLPNGTTRNFGEATQYVTYPMGRPQVMYDLARNFTDPNHISNWDPLLVGINLGNNNTTNPFLTRQGQISAYQWGANMAAQMQIQQAIQGIAGALNSMESSLSNLVQSENLTNAQKATLQGLLEEVKALKERIANQLRAKNPTQEEVAAMQQEVLELQKKVGEAADKIRAEVNEAVNNENSPAASTPSSNSNETHDNNADLAGTEYQNIDPETGRHTSLGNVPSKAECRQFCATIFDAIDGIGTKNDVIEQTIPGLTAGNIVEVISYWNKNYGSGDQGMIRRLIDDLGHGEKKKYVPMLLNALQTRAEALGIDDEIDTYVTNITKELSDWNISDGICSKNLTAIYDKIVEKENANKTGAKTTIEGKEAENNRKVQERRTQVENEKRNEIANKMKEQLNLNDVPQLAAGLKVETDDNGEFTGYSIELNTENGKVKVNGCTYQQLVVEIEKNNLKAEDVLIRNTNA